MDNITRRIHASGEWLKFHKRQIGLVAVGVIGLGLSYGTHLQVTDETTWVYNKLLELNNVIDANIVGHYALGMADYAINSVNSLISLTKPDAKPLLKIAEFIPKAFTAGTLLAPVAALGVGRVYDSVFARRDRELRLREGIEPIRQNESPAHVIVGPSDLISDSITARYEGKKKIKNQPVVGIHLDQNVPPEFGRNMEYHFRIGNITEFLGLHAPSIKPINTIEATGMDRAQELTFVCFNPDNALFYEGNETQIPPTAVSTIIRRIPPEKMKGKKVNVILPKDIVLGRTTAIEEELKVLAEELDFNLFLKIPEDIIAEKITNRLVARQRVLERKRPLSVLLVGEGRELRDQLMLASFRNEITSLTVEGQPVVGRIINHRDIEGLPMVQGDPTGPERRVAELKSLISSSDLIVVYGDKDTGTSSLARLIVRQGGSQERMLAIIERPSIEFELQLENIPFECVYRLAIESTSQENLGLLE